MLIHIRLKVGGSDLMGSDKPDSIGKVKFGDSVNISYNTDDDTIGKEIFNKLATGGTVTMPLQDTFWCAKHGQVTDKFGLNWMVNCQKEA